MKNKEIRIRMDSDFEQKVDYLKEINGYKNKSDTIRKVLEKEWRKEATMKGNFVDIDSLVRAFKKRWRESENQSMTYPEIITFIRDVIEQ